jgi:hypothetical protein
MKGRPESRLQAIEKIDSAPGLSGGSRTARRRTGAAGNLSRIGPRQGNGTFGDAGRPEFRLQALEKIDSAPEG